MEIKANNLLQVMGKHENVLYTQKGLHDAHLLPVMFATFE